MVPYDDVERAAAHLSIQVNLNLHDELLFFTQRWSQTPSDSDNVWNLWIQKMRCVVPPDFLFRFIQFTVTGVKLVNLDNIVLMH
jgi:hypothetical protein